MKGSESFQANEDNKIVSQTTNEDFFESKIIKLPRQFEKSFLERFDRRFFSILVTSLILHFVLAVYFIINPPSEESTASRLARIQEQLAKSIMEREVQLQESIAELNLMGKQSGRKEESVEETGSAETKEAKEAKEVKEVKEAKESTPKKSAAEIAKERRRAQFRQRAGGGRGKVQEQIASAIGSKGILALLTSTSSTATGSGVEDLLKVSSGAQQDLDKALSGMSGLKKGGAKETGGTGDGSGLKGGRNQNLGGIDELVTGMGNAKSGSFERTGKLVVVGESSLIKGSGQNAILGRDQDDVQGVVTGHNNAIQYCYERELKRNPELRGKLVLRITITPQGTIKKIEIVSSTLNNRKVERCVVSRIRRWSDFGSINPKYGDTIIRQTYAFGY